MRYGRQESIVGRDGQERLMGSRVGIAGCGGLGVHAITSLVQAGVTNYVVYDSTIVDIPDINHQFIYAPGDLRPKSVIASEWILALNYSSMAEAYSEPMGPQNLRMFEGCDLVLDCLENPEEKRMLAEWCAENDIVLIHADVCGTSGTVAVLYPEDRARMMELVSESRGIIGSPQVGACVAYFAAIMAWTAIEILSGINDCRGKIVRSDLASE